MVGVDGDTPHLVGVPLKDGSARPGLQIPNPGAMDKFSLVSEPLVTHMDDASE